MYMRAMYLNTLQHRFPMPSKDFLEREQKLYVGPGEASEEAELSVNQCLAIINQQRRESLFPQDKIYGVLGLFPPVVRFSLPARYDVPLSAVFTILTYLRICNGDLYSFMVDEDRACPEHEIADCPSWLPSRHGQMRLLNSKPAQEPVPQDDPLLPSWPEQMIKVDGRKLILTAPYLDIVECALPENAGTLTVGEEQIGFIPMSPFWLLPNIPAGHEQPETSDKPEPVQSYRQRTNVFLLGSGQDFLSGNGNVMGRPLVPPVGFTQTKPRIEKANLLEPYTAKLDLIWSSIGNIEYWDEQHWQEILQNRKDIAAAVAAKQAVMVNFAYTKDGLELWMVLISNDDGETWRKAGNVMVENKMVKGYEKFGLAMRPWQKSNKHARTFVVL
jgi:hypothetical protein